jgi:hypothetical protein
MRLMVVEAVVAVLGCGQGTRMWLGVATSMVISIVVKMSRDYAGNLRVFLVVYQYTGTCSDCLGTIHYHLWVQASHL